MSPCPLTGSSLAYARPASLSVDGGRATGSRNTATIITVSHTDATATECTLVGRQQRSVALVLHKWVKERQFLKAVPVEQGESSVALLILCEADHTPFLGRRHEPSIHQKETEHPATRQHPC